MLEVRPEIAEREAAFRDKIALAMELRALRDTANMSQEQIAALSALPFRNVQACEALAGEMPTEGDVAAYRAAVHAQKAGD
ncbi:hypothetical protein DEM26_07620 [Thioclava sp. NG1]|nr:hypothetical protein DEM26_07620 [Thioclava sp. NG1]